MSQEFSRRAALTIFGSGIMLVGCKKFLSQAGSRTFTSADGKREITTPSSWSESHEKNESAEINVGNRFAETYALVISESKQDFVDYTVERYSSLTRGIVISRLSDTKLGIPEQVMISGKPAIQTEIRGSYTDVNLVYLHTCVDLTGYYSQVMTWTLSSRWKNNQAVLRQVTSSFRELA